SGALAGATQAAADAFALLTRWNYSLTTFYLRRMQRQMELPLRLARAASPAELMELRDAFQADLVVDYSDEAEALHRSCTDRGLTEADRYQGALLKAQEHASGLIDQAKVQAERIIASARVRADEIVAEANARPAPARRSA